MVKVLLGEEGEVVDDREEVSKKIAEYFLGVYKKRGDEPLITCTWDQPVVESDSGFTFSNEEVKEAVKECNFNKGLGPDGFNGSILKPD